MKLLTFPSPADHITFTEHLNQAGSIYLFSEEMLSPFELISAGQVSVQRAGFKRSDMQRENLNRQTEGCKTDLNCQKSLKELSVSMQSITLHLLSSPDFPPYKAT